MLLIYWSEPFRSPPALKRKEVIVTRRSPLLDFTRYAAVRHMMHHRRFKRS